MPCAWPPPGGVGMADRIVVRGIRGFGHHGVLAHEAEIGQEFTVDIEIDTDFTAAVAADDLDQTVDYGQVARLAHARLVGPPFLLIESLADAIAAEVAALPGVQAVTATVHKPHAPMPVGVGDVAVTRHRRPRARVVLGLGSNLGDRFAHLRRAVASLRAEGVDVTAVSPVVRSDPAGGPAGQDEFLNAVVVGATDLSPHELLRVCRAIEDAAERDRSVRWGPRPIDVDVLDFAGHRVVEPDLVLPHPRIVDRPFVLVPWAQVAPHDRPGATGPTVAQLADAVGADAVRLAPEYVWGDLR